MFPFERSVYTPDSVLASLRSLNVSVVIVPIVLDAFLQALEGRTDILPKQKYSEAMMKEFQQNEALAMQNEEVVKEALSDDYDYVLKEKEDNVTNVILSGERLEQNDALNYCL